MSDIHEPIANSPELAAAVDALNAQAAPSDPVQRALAALHDRLSQIELRVGAGVARTLHELVVAADDAAPPILHRLEGLETWGRGVYEAFTSMFGDKHELPAPPKLRPEPPPAQSPPGA